MGTFPNLTLTQTLHIPVVVVYRHQWVSSHPLNCLHLLVSVLIKNDVLVIQSIIVLQSRVTWST